MSEITETPRERFEQLLWILVGENVGKNCDCGGCEENRETMRNAVNELIKAEKSNVFYGLDVENGAGGVS